MRFPQTVRLIGATGVLAVGLAVAVSATPAAAAPKAPTSGKDNASKSAAAVVAGRPAYLHASAKDAFVQRSVISSGNVQYVPYERTYAGLPVVGGDFVFVTNDAGQILSKSVSQTKAIGNLSVQPKVTAAAAEAVAGKQLKTVTAVEGSKLVVHALGDTAKLAWESIVQGTSAEGPSRLSVYVDAQTGKVLGTTEHVTDVTGSGTGWIDGSVSLNTTLSGSTYSMTDPTVTNLRCQNATGNVTFTGSDNVWGNGVSTDRETGCVDALYTAQKQVSMLSSWLGRNAQNGSGGAWPLRVGLNDQNAYYDGTQIQIGKNTAGAWIASLDVVGHELGHGIDDTTPGGISNGNTQEFVADTFGAATEAFANNPNDPPDYQVGEEVNLVGSGPIRYMYNPSLAGDANCYSSSIPTQEVHAAAGPGNHWFYLLAEGSSPTNGQPSSPTCNSSSVTGIGIQNAMKIMYNAMLMKTSTSSYLKYRTWTLTAAKNLFPSSCTQFNTVKAAWDAVSVPAQSGDPTCTVGSALALGNPGSQSGTVGVAASLALSATGGTTPYTFSATGLPAGLSINASSGVISGTPTTAATYSVTATVTDNASPTHATASQTFTWTIGTAGSCSSPGQKIVNPGFESGNTPWTASTGVLGNTSGQTAHSGTKYAWLDGYGTTHTDTLSQSVTLPAGCTTYSLNFYLHIDSAETTTTTQYDKLTLKVGSTTLATYSNLNKATGYTLRTINVAAYAGQTITLAFTGTEDASLQTSFVLDDFALNVS